MALNVTFFMMFITSINYNRSPTCLCVAWVEYVITFITINFQKTFPCEIKVFLPTLSYKLQ